MKAERIDCGEYKVIAKNEKGDVESTTCLLEEEMLKVEVSCRKKMLQITKGEKFVRNFISKTFMVKFFLVDYMNRS